MVDREAGAHLLGAHNHRAQLEQLEVDAVLAHPLLAVENGAAIAELDRQRRQPQKRARDGEPEPGHGDVGGAVHQRVPSAASQVAGTPRRR